MIQAVIFDIGNVLIEWHPEHYFDRHFGKERREAFFAHVDLSTMNNRLDSGEGFQAVLQEYISANPQFEPELKAWRDDWIQLASPIIPQSVQLLRALKRSGVPVFSLTNYGKDTFAYSQTVYSFFNEFDRDYVSGHMKIMKPDPRIFQRVEEDCGITPEHLLFTDDREDNIEAAQKRGWQTHQFKGAKGLQDCLVSHDLLKPQDLSKPLICS